MGENLDGEGQEEAGLRRREALAKFAKFGAVTAPVVLAMLIPTKAVAQTGKAPGGVQD